MDYTIKQVAEISGVSSRTLRYYDEIGLLKPARLTEAGYRIYTTAELDYLQQILFYRALDFKLEQIKELLARPDYEILRALTEQRQALVQKRAQLDQLVTVIDQTIAYQKGEVEMTEAEKFAGFKEKLVAENESKYGKEIREHYGDESIEAANQKMLQLTKAEFSKRDAIEADLLDRLKEYLKEPTKEQAAEIFKLHKSWLAFSWSTYSKQAHQGLAQLYLADSRFRDYYDQKVGVGATEALAAIILQEE